MGTYGLEGVLLAWKAETLTTEQAVGQILLLLQEMERRLAALERVVTWPATPASTPAPAAATPPPPAPATPPPPSAPGESAAPAPQPEKAEQQSAPVKSADPAPKHRRGKRHTRAGRRRKPPAA